MLYMGGWAVRVLDLLGLDELAIELVAGVDAGRPPVAGCQRERAPAAAPIIPTCARHRQCHQAQVGAQRAAALRAAVIGVPITLLRSARARR